MAKHVKGSADYYIEIFSKMEKAKESKGKYPTVSWKDAPVPARYPVPKCCCGKPCHIAQSIYPTTAGRAYYCCYDNRKKCRCYFFQWIDGPEGCNDYFLKESSSILTSSKPAETWRRLPTNSPPPVYVLDETTPNLPELVWCAHCDDMTRWCPLYGEDTFKESWKVFEEEERSLERAEDERRKAEVEKRETEELAQRKLRARHKREYEEYLRREEAAKKQREDEEEEEHMAWLSDAYAKFRHH